MLAVTISTGGLGNCVEVAGIPYVYADGVIGEFVLPASCPHRGGPLHLASVEPGTSRLICPWHGRATSVTRAVRHGIPAVRNQDRVTIVLPVEESASVRIGHRPVSEQLCRPRPEPTRSVSHD